MPTVSISNTVVSRSANSPIPNPILPIVEPADIPSVSVANTLTPFVFGAIGLADVLAPVNVTPQTVGTLGTPSVATSTSVASIATPTATNPESVATIGLPTIRNAVAVATIGTPVIKTAQSVPTLSTPSARTPESIPATSTPSVYTANTGGTTTPPFPLNHARILYANLLNGSGVTATGGSQNPEYALIPNTFQAWSFTSSTAGTITITLPSSQNIDTICIGAHNLKGETIQVQYDANLTDPFTTFAPSKTVTTNDAIMFHIATAVSARRVRITVSGNGGLNHKVGFISAGVALQMPRPFFSGHNPMNQNKKHRYFDAYTESGNMVGRAKRSVMLEGDFQWNNIPDVWYRTYMPAFIESATRLPYFIAWNLLQYEDDCAMAFTDEDISAPYSGTRDLRSISFSARGIA